MGIYTCESIELDGKELGKGTVVIDNSGTCEINIFGQNVQNAVDKLDYVAHVSRVILKIITKG